MARDDSFAPESIEYIRTKEEARRLGYVCRETLNFGDESDVVRRLDSKPY